MSSDYGFAEIDAARKELGLDEYATLDELKRAYKELASQMHPDLNNGSEQSEDRFKRITNAYNVLSDYCMRYRYSFKQETVKRVNMDPKLREYLKRYYDGMWGTPNV